MPETNYTPDVAVTLTAFAPKFQEVEVLGIDPISLVDQNGIKPSVQEFFDFLKEQNKAVVIVSSARKYWIQKILRHYSIESYSKMIVCADNMPDYVIKNDIDNPDEGIGAVAMDESTSHHKDAILIIDEHDAFRQFMMVAMDEENRYRWGLPEIDDDNDYDPGLKRIISVTANMQLAVANTKFFTNSICCSTNPEYFSELLAYWKKQV